MFLAFGIKSDNETRNLTQDVYDVKRDIEEYRINSEKHSEAYQPKTYGVNESEYYILIQDLCNKGLLVDRGMVYGAEPCELVEVTKLWHNLLDAIRE